MPWEAWATLVTILIMTVALMRNLGGPDTVLFAGLTLLITLGLFAGTDADGNVLLPSAKEAVMGFGNEGLITIGILFILAEGLRQTGAMSLITQPLLGMPKNVLVAQTRMMLPRVIPPRQ